MQRKIQKQLIRKEVQAALIAEPVKSAELVGLRYVSDTSPGIQRQCVGEEFCYIDANGKQICDQSELSRIKALVIPPAWTDVWICPLPHGHLQATGRDVKGRKQYRYHAHWRKVRSQTNFILLLTSDFFLAHYSQLCNSEPSRTQTVRRTHLAQKNGRYSIS